MNCIVSEFNFVYVFYLEFYLLKTSRRQENSLILENYELMSYWVDELTSCWVIICCIISMMNYYELFIEKNFRLNIIHQQNNTTILQLNNSSTRQFFNSSTRQINNSS